MANSRPFASDSALFEASDAIWRELREADWLEAFDGHPRIGGAIDTTSKSAEWSKAEQSGAAGAGDDVAQALSEGNRAYEERFGHVFLICATGKSAPEMLAALQKRMHNDPSTELRIAADEQAKITRLRLARLAES